MNKPFVFNKEQEEKDYKNQIFTALAQISEIAFLNGIKIDSVAVRDSWIQLINNPLAPGYGDKFIISAPDINKYEDDFGVIPIRRI